MIRRLRGAEGPDRGATLPEMLVVMLIMGIVVTAVATLTIGFQRTNTQTMVRQDQVDVARTAVERLTKTVRTSVRPSQLASGCDGCATQAFLSATANGLQFYANLGNDNGDVGPSRVTYVLQSSADDGTVLVEKVQRPDKAKPDNTGYTYCNAEAAGASSECRSRLTVRTIARGVQTSGTALFRYFDNNGDVMTPAAGGLPADKLSQIVQIEVQVKVQTVHASQVEPTTYLQRVTLPNSQAVFNQKDEK